MNKEEDNKKEIKTVCEWCKHRKYINPWIHNNEDDDSPIWCRACPLPAVIDPISGDRINETYKRCEDVNNGHCQYFKKPEPKPRRSYKFSTIFSIITIITILTTIITLYFIN